VLISKQTKAYLAEDSAVLALRWMGRRVGIEVGATAAEKAVDLLFFGQTEGLGDASLALLVRGDRFAIEHIYQNGVVPEILGERRNGKNIDPFDWNGRDVADLPKLYNPNSKQFRWAAARRLEFVVRRTQPMFDMLDRSVSQSNPSPIERSFFYFRTAIEAQENIADRALDTYIKSDHQLSDGLTLTRKWGAVVTANMAVAVWKKGLKWAIATGLTAGAAAFGIFKFKDPETESLPTTMAKDTVKNLARLSRFGKFAVIIGERVADELAGEGYNWNRNAFENPVLAVLETGVDAGGAITRVIVDAGYLDEFVAECEREGDEPFNAQLADRIVDDVTTALRASFEFGTRIAGIPVLAPFQEFVKPAMEETKIRIIRELTFGDVDDPGIYATRIWTLYEVRKKLTRKGKTTRLSPTEERVLSRLNSFTSIADKQTDVIRQLSDQSERARQFQLFETKMSRMEEEVIDNLR